jgi:hypothetical protein
VHERQSPLHTEPGSHWKQLPEESPQYFAWAESRTRLDESAGNYRSNGSNTTRPPISSRLACRAITSTRSSNRSADLTDARISSDRNKTRIPARCGDQDWLGSRPFLRSTKTSDTQCILPSPPELNFVSPPTEFASSLNWRDGSKMF